MPSKPCKKMGCPNLVRDGSGYCVEHQEVKRQREQASAKVADSFYGSGKWKRLREYKRKVNPLCEMCLAKGITKGSAMVDHIKPVKSGGARLDINNLQSLCLGCHAVKTADDKSKKLIGV